MIVFTFFANWALLRVKLERVRLRCLALAKREAAKDLGMYPSRSLVESEDERTVANQGGPESKDTRVGACSTSLNCCMQTSVYTAWGECPENGLPYPNYPLLGSTRLTYAATSGVSSCPPPIASTASNVSFQSFAVRSNCNTSGPSNHCWIMSSSCVSPSWTAASNASLSKSPTRSHWTLMFTIGL